MLINAGSLLNAAGVSRPVYRIGFGDALATLGEYIISILLFLHCAKVLITLIHDLLFLPISTIESRVS